MSKRSIIVLMSHCHKFLDPIYLLFIHINLFNNTVSSSDYVVLNGRMISE
jgi:hypothetical protein